MTQTPGTPPPQGPGPQSPQSPQRMQPTQGFAHGPQSPQFPQAGQPPYGRYAAGTAGFAAGMQFNVGSVLSRTMETLKQGLPVFCILTVVSVIIPAIIESFMTPTIAASYYYSGDFYQSYLIPFAGQLLLNLLMQGAIAYAVYQVMRGDKADVPSSLKRGFARFIPLALICLIAGLILVVGVIALAILAYIASALGVIGVIVGSIGIIAGVVGAVVLAMMWAVVIPACVVERLGPIASLKRSAALTNGHRGTIFGVTLITYIIIIGIGMLANAIFSRVLPFSIASIVVALVLVLPSAYQNVMTATMYYDLRAVKEGVTVDKLVNVFD